ncbi:kinase-like domain-containing protein [Radiomyces spectabilis]|uniref:kinase-like domain-containing protein n=1 Tax=Radiomyces spectabilis TaxID=64574 RepID=UPI00222123A9|nr:kinase-like domain-containing protein [Radiomyces spectabilis]KAI8377806.1 kinase-like domain-containing protein [Radiomyces spectabilis]
MNTTKEPSDNPTAQVASSNMLTSAEDTSAITPKPILVTTPSSNGASTKSQAHNSRRSISGSDILNGLKIMTNPQFESSTPTSPVPSQMSAEPALFNNIDDFELREAIGYGSSAIVYSAIYKPYNKRVALKQIDLDMFERNQIDELRRETALMALSKHANVLRVYGSFVKGSKLYIVTPYSAGGSCLDIMKTGFPDGLDELSIATILKQALEGLAYLHKNGHIHRDVKAGNLLMDEDGTVLLADFGVSSSLMETGEKGMRKTFVGTPCWMAPEVMEQASYDYKADIWSFGITAIELATGHAPFAKLPPLKVLMMTLSSDPPTLARETTTHKYSRIFREMIDMCLNKDPTKRPSAEKLLLHPFFKQAKKKDYLAKCLLADLPALEHRPRKRMPRKQITTSKTDEWDFDNLDDSEMNEETGDYQGPHVTDTQQQEANSAERPPNPGPVPKRHISFGDVVVRNPSQPVVPQATVPVTHQSADAVPLATPARKSRFVIEDGSREVTDTYATYSSSARSVSPLSEIDARSDQSDSEMIRSRGSLHHVRERPMSMSSDHHVSSGDDSQDHVLAKTLSHENMLDRKSRFEVQHNQLPTAASPPRSSFSTSHYPNSNPSISPMPHYSIALSRENSNSSTGFSLTRDGSSQSRAAPRYPMDKERDGREMEGQPQQPLGECRKIGRFELTCGSSELTPRLMDAHLHPYDSASPNHSVTPPNSVYGPRGQMVRTSSSDPSMNPNLYSQVEELMRYNEAQRQLLLEICGSLNVRSNFGRKSYHDLKKASSLLQPSSSSLTTAAANAPESTASDTKDVNGTKGPSEDLLSTVEYLEHLVQLSLRENASLQKKNDALRKEIDQLRNMYQGVQPSNQQQQPQL